MSSVIFIITLSVLIALAGGIVAAWDRLTNPDRGKMILGILSLLIILFGQGLQSYQTWRKEKVIIEKEEREAIQNAFREHMLHDIDEASGGAVVDNGKLAYLVDDETPELFKLKFDEKDKRYKLDTKFPIRKTGSSKITVNAVDPADIEGKICSQKREFDDFEGAAAYGDKLYVITSHSNKQSGDRCLEREWFLELSLEKGHEGEVIRGTNRLRKAILEEFRKPEVINTDRLNEETNPQKEVMNIEGLTIDGQGRVYIGFREPLAGRKYAVVLGAELGQLFGDAPVFKRYLLDLNHPDDQGNAVNYAIVSMDYDARTGNILILGNSEERIRKPPLVPVVWSWQVKEGIDQGLMEGKQFVIKMPEYVTSAKPEVILAPPGDTLYFFLDAERYGGQWSFARKELGLQN